MCKVEKVIRFVVSQALLINFSGYIFGNNDEKNFAQFIFWRILSENLLETHIHKHIYRHKYKKCVLYFLIKVSDENLDIFVQTYFP